MLCTPIARPARIKGSRHLYLLPDFVTGLAVESNGDIIVQNSGTAYTISPDGSTLINTFSTDAASAISVPLGMILLPGNRLLSVGIGYSDTTIVLERYDLSQRLAYAEQDANYDVTSLTDSNGNVVERYSYASYGTVTVLNADGTTEGDGTIASSSVGWVYTFQDGWIDPVTGLVHFPAS